MEAKPTSPGRKEKRERIVRAAVQVFAEKGYRAARISDIARSARVADGTIYLYFKNKENLLLTIFEEKMADLITELRIKLAKSKGPLNGIRIYAHHHFSQLQQNPLLAQVFQVELRQSTKFVRNYRPEKLWEYLDIFSKLIIDGQAQGQIRADRDPFITQWAFFGALDELSIQWVLARKRERFDLDQAADQVVDIFLNGLQNKQPS